MSGCLDAVRYAIAAILVAGCAHEAAVGDGRVELVRARTAIAKGDASHAIVLYDRVPRFSWWWPTALFEETRERARKHADSAALGLIMTLHAPQLADWVFPEAYAIEAEIYARNCYYERALAIARQFRRDVLPLREPVMALLDGDPGRDDNPWIATRVRGARTAAERWDALDQLLIEIDLADTTLERIAADSAERLTQLVDADHQGHREAILIVDDGYHLYPFDGEYWPDELGHYRVRLRSACQRR